MKYSIRTVLLGLILVISFSCNVKSQDKDSNESTVIQVIDASEYSNKLADAILIDVRTPAEFNNGHLEGAVNVNYFDPDFLEQLATYNKDEAVYLYCRSGNRSAKASRKMKEAGFSNIIDLKGGIKSWIRKDFKIVN